MNKPISYSKDNQLLDTELYRQVGDLMGGAGVAKHPKVVDALRDVFGLPLGRAKRVRKTPKKKT